MNIELKIRKQLKMNTKRTFSYLYEQRYTDVQQIYENKRK